MLPGLAAADAVGPPQIISLYDGTTVLSSVAYDRKIIEVAEAGELLFDFDQLDFPAISTPLSFSVADGVEVLGTIAGTGSLRFEVGGARALFAYAHAASAPSIAAFACGVTTAGAGAAAPRSSVGLLAIERRLTSMTGIGAGVSIFSFRCVVY
jgi:hypothetical protein